MGGSQQNDVGRVRQVRLISTPESDSVSGELVAREIANPPINWSASKVITATNVLVGLRELRTALVIATAEVG
jgi:hypothetical protein